MSHAGTLRRLLALIVECCDVAEKHIADHNFGWAEFAMARAQQAADVYETLDGTPSAAQTLEDTK